MAMQIRLGVEGNGPQRGVKIFFMLREPTAGELNTFRIRIREYLRHGDVDLASLCRAEFFDLLLQSVENLNGNDGKPITPDRKIEIPEKWKDNLIFNSFEDSEGVSFLKKLGVHYGS